MKEVVLGSGAVALVDDEDYELINQFHWSEVHKGKTSYAVRFHRIGDGKQLSIYMHRVIMNAKTGELVDHIKGNGLDNRKSELRRCCKKDNQRNRPGACKGSSSCYLGVSWSSERRKWVAQIGIGDTHIGIGRFDREEDAAYAYNLAAAEHFGEFAHLNELPDGDWNATPLPRSSRYQRRNAYPKNRKSRKVI